MAKLHTAQEEICTVKPQLLDIINIQYYYTCAV